MRDETKAEYQIAMETLKAESLQSGTECRNEDIEIQLHNILYYTERKEALMSKYIRDLEALIARA